MTNVTPINNTKTTEGMAEAGRLAFACFVEGMSYEGFSALPMDDQVAFAVDNARLGIDELIMALRFLGRYHMARAAALEQSRARKGHA